MLEVKSWTRSFDHVRLPGNRLGSALMARVGRIDGVSSSPDWLDGDRPRRHAKPLLHRRANAIAKQHTGAIGGAIRLRHSG
jgi:hypothetical protein